MRGTFQIWARRLTALAVLSGVLTIGVAKSLPAGAPEHSSLVRSIPAPGSSGKDPTQVDLWFNRPLAPDAASVQVLPAASLNLMNLGSALVNLARGTPVLDPRDPTHLRVILEPLPPGNYAVQWRVGFRDGHTEAAQLIFQVTEHQ